jgi:hypothetical protein
LGHRRSSLLNSTGGRFAAREEKRKSSTNQQESDKAFHKIDIYSAPRFAQSSSFLFCIGARAFVDWRTMIELEVYAAGLRDLSKILQLDHELEAIACLRDKVDSNHDIVYMELEEPTITFREIRAIFKKLGLDPRFIGAIPSELRPKSKTQPLNV